VYTEAAIPPTFVSTNSNFKFGLWARSEIPWSNACTKSRVDIEGQKNFVSHIRAFQIVLLIVSIFTFLLFSLAIPIVAWRTKGHWTDNRKVWYCQTFLNVIFKSFVIAFTLATMFISLAVLKYWQEVDGSTPEKQCSDPLSTEVFKILTGDYKDLSYSNIGSSVSMGFTGFLDFFMHLVRVCRR
jgi:hypothetical protein